VRVTFFGPILSDKYPLKGAIKNITRGFTNIIADISACE